MAKADIHPKQHKIFAQLSDGTKIEIVTAYGNENEVLKLDIDPTNHPAWLGDKFVVNTNSARIDSFNKKFGGFDFGVKAKKEETN